MSGYYCLHKEGYLFYSRYPVTGNFVQAYFPFEPKNRNLIWDMIINVSNRYISVFCLWRLCHAWQCNPYDLAWYLRGIELDCDDRSAVNYYLSNICRMSRKERLDWWNWWRCGKEKGQFDVESMPWGKWREDEAYLSQISVLSKRCYAEALVNSIKKNKC